MFASSLLRRFGLVAAVLAGLTLAAVLLPILLIGLAVYLVLGGAPRITFTRMRPGRPPRPSPDPSSDRTEVPPSEDTIDVTAVEVRSGTSSLPENTERNQ